MQIRSTDADRHRLHHNRIADARSVGRRNIEDSDAVIGVSDRTHQPILTDRSHRQRLWKRASMQTASTTATQSAEYNAVSKSRYTWYTSGATNGRVWL